jgi:hypothetical protein
MRGILLLVVVTLGCRSAVPSKPAPVAAPAPQSTASVTAKMIVDPNAPSVQLPPGETYVEPQVMRGNPLPQYPRDLVPLALGPHEVVVRITSNEESRIEEIRASPLGGTTDDAYRARFEEAVSSAVKQWKVFPAEIRKMKDGPDLDGDGKPDYTISVGRKVLKVFFDVAFRFEIVNGKPVVRSDRPQGATVQP